MTTVTAHALYESCGKNWD